MLLKYLSTRQYFYFVVQQCLLLKKNGLNLPNSHFNLGNLQVKTEYNIITFRLYMQMYNIVTAAFLIVKTV